MSNGDPEGRVAKWIILQGYATGHGDTVEDMLRDMQVQMEERITKSIQDTHRMVRK